MDTRTEKRSSMQTSSTPPRTARFCLRSLTGLLLGLMTFTALAVDPGWVRTPGLLSNMTVHAVVKKADGSYMSQLLTPGSKMAAFKGAECRGVASIFNGSAPQDGQFQVNVGSNSSSEAGMTLKVWDAALDQVYDIKEGFSFAVDTTLGTIGAPGEYTLVLAPPTPTPAVATPVTVAEGDTTSFAVTVRGGIAPYTYAWTVAGASAGGNASTFVYAPDFATVLHPAQSALKPVVCTVTDAAGVPATVTATWTNVVVTDVDRLPTDPVVSVTPAAPTTSAALSVNYTTTSTDADGDPITYHVVWTHGGTTVTAATLPAAQTKRGETGNVAVFARTTPCGGNVDSATATASVVIQNTPPVAVAAGVLPVPITAYSSNNPLTVLTGSDADAADGVDTLSFALVDDVVHGVLKTSANGTRSNFNAATGALD